MELRITTQMEPGVLPEINWNHEELKQEVALKAQEYANIAYTDEQAAEMKKDRATLNKLVTAFEDQRKQVKKFYQAPYEKFEAQVKEILVPVRGAIRTIDDGLAEIDRQYRVTKTNRMRELYEQYSGDLKGIVPFQKTSREENYKKSVTDKKLEQYYSDFFKRVNEDMESIEALPERFRDKILLKYSDTLSISDALREGKRLEELEKSMEERRKRQEEEKKLSQASHVVTQEKKLPETENRHEISNVDNANVEQCFAQEETITLVFRVCGTKSQLLGLRQYMVDNRIKFGKVE